MLQRKRQLLLMLTCLLAGYTNCFAQVHYPGRDPGMASVKTSVGQIRLENDVIELSFSLNGNKINPLEFEDKQSHKQIQLHDAPLFELSLRSGMVVNSNSFFASNLPHSESISADANAITYADRFSGKKITAELNNEKLGLKVHWEAILHDGSS